MGRAPCCDKTQVKRGAWSPEEDAALRSYLQAHHGTPGNWISLPHKAGLKRCGKGCRLRWLNYLRPHLNRGAFTHQEDNLILSLYSKMGSRWSVIAANLPGRTDNDVKNHWNTKLKKKLLARPDQNPKGRLANNNEAGANYNNENPNSPHQQQLYLPPSFTSYYNQYYSSSLAHTNALLFDQVMLSSSPNNYQLISGTESQEARSTAISGGGSSSSLFAHQTDNCLTYYPFHGTNVEDVLVLGDTGFGFGSSFIPPPDDLLLEDAGFGHS